MDDTITEAELDALLALMDMHHALQPACCMHPGQAVRWEEAWYIACEECPLYAQHLQTEGR